MEDGGYTNKCTLESGKGLGSPSPSLPVHRLSVEGKKSQQIFSAVPSCLGASTVTTASLFPRGPPTISSERSKIGFISSTKNFGESTIQTMCVPTPLSTRAYLTVRTEGSARIDFQQNSTVDRIQLIGSYLMNERLHPPSSVLHAGL